MNKEKILCLLGGIIGKNVNELAALPSCMSLIDIGLDSIRFIQFIVAVEEEFEIEILDSDLLPTNFETLEKLFATLHKYFIPSASVKKVLVCDCDNVLWHGVSGEEEIYLDEKTLSLQNELVFLQRDGIILCLCSRNIQVNIDKAFQTLPMTLQKDHIVVEKINYSDKANNIKTISDELNLALNSFVFIDDSDYEIGLINAVLPEVTILKADFYDPDFIIKLKNLFSYKPTQDLNRTQLYKEQKNREKSKLQYSTIEEYNSSLKTTLTCVPALPEQAERLSELSQRTNQFNLSCARFLKSDFENLINSSDHLVLSLSADDKYGDMGIVGAAVVSINKPKAIIEDFFLSCRIFGRDFEQILLDEIKKRFADYTLYGIYTPSERNKSFSEFYSINKVILYE